jgi:hypothetical protein
MASKASGASGVRQWRASERGATRSVPATTHTECGFLTSGKKISIDVGII